DDFRPVLNWDLGWRWLPNGWFLDRVWHPGWHTGSDANSLVRNDDAALYEAVEFLERFIPRITNRSNRRGSVRGELMPGQLADAPYRVFKVIDAGPGSRSEVVGKRDGIRSNDVLEEFPRRVVHPLEGLVLLFNEKECCPPQRECRGESRLAPKCR
ncbi:MAG: hypothetical protein L0Z51_12250, partial [Candidatus Latescibacteria bacterium]|nr:hypothetical protein [Candidatus Latescibacterota bacterium]